MHSPYAPSTFRTVVCLNEGGGWRVSCASRAGREEEEEVVVVLLLVEVGVVVNKL